jgi:hypothetical protein
MAAQTSAPCAPVRRRIGVLGTVARVVAGSMLPGSVVARQWSGPVRLEFWVRVEGASGSAGRTESTSGMSLGLSAVIFFTPPAADREDDVRRWHGPRGAARAPEPGPASPPGEGATRRRPRRRPGRPRANPPASGSAAGRGGDVVRGAAGARPRARIRQLAPAEGGGRGPNDGDGGQGGGVPVGQRRGPGRPGGSAAGRRPPPGHRRDRHRRRNG